MDRLKPLNDVVFKMLFGKQANKDLLIGLFNAIVPFRIIDAVIQEEKLTPKRIQDKTSFLDIKSQCKTEVSSNKVNMEVQLLNPYHMIPRVLFYWSKFFTEGLRAGENYNKLKKTVSVNLLGFNLLSKQASFHSSYGLYEHQTKQPLTDLVDIHFIEYPKFLRQEPDLHNPLHRWLLWLKEDTPEPIIREVIGMDSLIGRADEKLQALSADDEVRRWAELRDKGQRDWVSSIEGAKEEGREKGREEAQLEIAQSMMKEGISLDVIARTTGLNSEQLNKLIGQEWGKGLKHSAQKSNEHDQDLER